MHGLQQGIFVHKLGTIFVSSPLLLVPSPSHFPPLGTSHLPVPNTCMLVPHSAKIVVPFAKDHYGPLTTFGVPSRKTMRPMKKTRVTFQLSRCVLFSLWWPVPTGEKMHWPSAACLGSCYCGVQPISGRGPTHAVDSVSRPRSI